ncbi:hypothetical protein E4T81_00825 [Barnesiella sp. WM24]|uniref:EH signature domain-containing protein n=1 Tax=Barnesiella sp. WM24 TaxID=2558278 RepID=UPI0010718907|nr:EH signature domain-containing protein [Barnesiella sp. WM24]TFU95107.1 hypothetical protein E4T81_00825 [Barnesiella sp. WM24]
MSNVYGLLNLNRDILENFALQGRLIENNVETDRILRNATRKLKAIEDRMQDDGKRPDFNLQSIEEVIEKVKREANGTNEEWALKELRLVSYYMVRLRNEQKVFDHALWLLESNWKDIFVNGLMFFLMNSWNICADNLLIGVSELVKRHLINYSGSIKRYLILKRQTDLLEKAGPVRLATILSAKNIPLEDSPTILGYKASSLSFPYFSDVIINYFKRKQEIDYDEMENIFSKHSLDRTKKLIYAYLVEKAEDSGDGNFQGAVVRSARRILGDINVSTTWSPFTGATAEDIWQLNKAKDLIIAWGARKTVDAFFDVCVQDPRRRKCWLEYVGSIMDYRIVGSTSVRTKLQSNSEVASLLKSCFIETNSRVSTTAALVLFIKDKVFVEFSDVGSLYIYNSSNRVIHDIKRKRYIDSTADLKDTSIGMAIDQYSSWSYLYYDEGRITHRGEWEDRFRRWMREKMEMRPGQKVKYSIPKPAQTDNRQRFGIERLEDEKPAPKFQAVMPKVERHESSWGVSAPSQPSLFSEEEAPIPKSSPSSESNTPHPGYRIKREIRGLQSKWVFDDTCRVMADTDGIYVHLKKNGRTYYIAPSKITKFEGCSIWLVSSYNSNKKYTVQLAIQNKLTGKSYTKIWGTIERNGSDIVFAPLNGVKVNIHTQ